MSETGSQSTLTKSSTFNIRAANDRKQEQQQWCRESSSSKVFKQEDETSVMTISDLSLGTILPEVLSDVIKFLGDPRDLLHLEATCKNFHQVLQFDDCWKHAAPEFEHYTVNSSKEGVCIKHALKNVRKQQRGGKPEVLVVAFREQKLSRFLAHLADITATSLVDDHTTNVLLIMMDAHLISLLQLAWKLTVGFETEPSGAYPTLDAQVIEEKAVFGMSTGYCLCNPHPIDVTFDDALVHGSDRFWIVRLLAYRAGVVRFDQTVVDWIWTYMLWKMKGLLNAAKSFSRGKAIDEDDLECAAKYIGFLPYKVYVANKLGVVCANGLPNDLENTSHDNRDSYYLHNGASSPAMHRCCYRRYTDDSETMEQKYDRARQFSVLVGASFTFRYGLELTDFSTAVNGIRNGTLEDGDDKVSLPGGTLALLMEAVEAHMIFLIERTTLLLPELLEPIERVDETNHEHQHIDQVIEHRQSLLRHQAAQLAEAFDFVGSNFSHNVANFFGPLDIQIPLDVTDQLAIVRRLAARAGVDTVSNVYCDVFWNLLADTTHNLIGRLVGLPNWFWMGDGMSEIGIPVFPPVQTKDIIQSAGLFVSDLGEPWLAIGSLSEEEERRAVEDYCCLDYDDNRSDSEWDMEIENDDPRAGHADVSISDEDSDVSLSDEDSDDEPYWSAEEELESFASSDDDDSDYSFDEIVFDDQESEEESSADH